VFENRAADDPVSTRNALDPDDLAKMQKPDHGQPKVAAKITTSAWVRSERSLTIVTASFHGSKSGRCEFC
jgi:hypothetical protein